ncbi:MAG TPA: ribonuclease domain-containing protein [Marmoricola sp.]|nr:ribonuclease domain-containing protein [Marmoricola sp.]HNJ78181.1 ribonuclease domain-containing protein [Marmoricola sp.]HNN49357.1 ribonuclease domain-containing protein [Marmoricola sp.]HNO38895.1 ribonuclease domain-containing protein [Marmoricola sp.]
MSDPLLITRRITAAIAVLAIALAGGLLVSCATSTAPNRDQVTVRPTDGATISLAQLPAAARRTIALIEAQGPFPYERDGSVFGNYEGHLPSRPRGFYREYTVPTPGDFSRGARRIVAGRDGLLYYTDDHYNSFRRVIR